MTISSHKANLRYLMQRKPARNPLKSLRANGPFDVSLVDDAETLRQWYLKVRRELPWRQNRDPYRIWVSEVMLQQTTVAAVVPYYDRFMQRFPALASLAKAPLEDVLEHWAGLGYYSRARCLHRAAIELNERDFPRTVAGLEKLPGFGPYTSRAVASLAFDEKVGVLDGNVIRVLSRRHGLDLEWWKPQPREILQSIADRLAQCEAPADINQALMELGATLCTPRSPACLLCPWTKTCVATQTGRVESLPRKRPRREREIWKWSPLVIEKRQRVKLVPNDYAPFLKGHWILPGSVKRLSAPPTRFDYKGVVTHHDIFVCVQNPAATPPASEKEMWVALAEVKKRVPASMIRKAIERKRGRE